MSRVVVATAFGGPEVLSVVEQPTGSPGAGQVLLEVRAAGVNPADWKGYTGAFGTDPAKLPLRLGFEASGVVAAVGPDAVGPAGPLAVGDAVIGFRLRGAYASSLVVPATALVPKPAALDWAEAAGLMLTGATAVHALTAIGAGAGDTVLVHGAAGGVGQALVQLAVAGGARVIGTAGASGAETVRRLGGEPVGYGDGLAERVRAMAPDGVTAAVDAVGTDEALDTSLELVGDRQRIATIANFARGGQAGIKVLGSGPGADPGTALRDAARLGLTALVEAGRLEVQVAGRYPLDDVAAAHREGMTGHSHGKLVLVP
ncbi:NADP-dependent oxidoreductase [Modestobacter versicolor]|uniref:NADP-dependent oxidoreductase n=1 Tax=Modestobacter versicolor TaxID=429133 RepID=A0A323V946_9ACTN|nr:NADP-dependent oxidoreductase [Modestobacter versicolor]MBB3674983.1 NADPH:quinone reductase-like Zn-dependent oxidoreductase [Modestobacter versicolor]PZA20620.1 NADP-dependent oxidoreductase [Modestobacter versicolor]